MMMSSWKKNILLNCNNFASNTLKYTARHFFFFCQHQKVRTSHVFGMKTKNYLTNSRSCSHWQCAGSSFICCTSLCCCGSSQDSCRSAVIVASVFCTQRDTALLEFSWLNLHTLQTLQASLQFVRYCRLLTKSAWI